MNEDFRNVRLWREQYRLTQRQLGQLVGANHSTVCAWEKGTKIPHSRHRIELRNIFGGISEAELRNGPRWESADRILSELPEADRDKALEMIKAMIATLFTMTSFHTIPNLADLADDLLDLAWLLQSLD